MATWYVKSGSSAKFVQSHAYVSTSGGDKMVPVENDAGSNVALARKWVWQCTTSGTSAAANPTWPASVTQDVTTVTSNTAVFTARKPGFSSGTTPDWTFASCFLAYVCTAASTGDTIYVSQNHAESSSVASANVATFGFTSSALTGPVNIICANDGAAPPTAAATGGSVTNTAAVAFIFNGNMNVYGLIFNCGTGSASNSCIYNFGNATNSYQFFESCTFNLTSTGANCRFNFGNSSGPALVLWRKCNTTVSNTGQAFSCDDTVVKFRWDQGQTAGSAATMFFTTNGGRLSNIEVTGVDMSVAGFATAGNILNVATAQGTSGLHIFRGLKLPASWSGSPITGTLSSLQTSRVEMYNWDSGTGTSNNKIWIKDYTGEITTETSITRSGGAAGPDGTAMSWKFVTTANTTFPYVILGSTEYMEIPVYTNDTSSHTYTVSLISDTASAYTNAQVWMDCFQMTGSTTLYTLNTTRVSDIIATPTNLSSDSGSTWNNTGGMSNPNKMKMALTITEGIKGPLLFRVYVAVASKTIYFDPFVQVT